MTFVVFVEEVQVTRIRVSSLIVPIILVALAAHGDLSASAQAARPTPAVVEPPPMPSERQMAKPAPMTGDAGMVGPDRSTRADSDQSAAKERYEDEKLARLAELNTQIADLRTKAQSLRGREKDAAMAPLRTAAGNRVVAITKLQHLYAAPPEVWLRFKPAVDRAFADLESAVQRTKAILAH